MRTQIALEPEQHAMVKQRAADLGISMAEYIRRVVERDLRRPDSRADVSAIFGLASSEGSDIAAEGKGAVAEAIEAHWRERTV